MQPVLAAKWITVGWLACGLSQASRHRVRQGPPVERIPLGDQCNVVALVDRGQIQSTSNGCLQRCGSRIQLRDRPYFARRVLLIDMAQHQFGPDRASERFVRGDEAIKFDALCLEEIPEAGVRAETGRALDIALARSRLVDITRYQCCIADGRVGDVEWWRDRTRTIADRPVAVRRPIVDLIDHCLQRRRQLRAENLDLGLIRRARLSGPLGKVGT